MPKRSTNKDNAKKTQGNGEEPWNKQFEDDRDESGSFSRVQKRKQTRGNKLLTTSFVVLLVFLFMVPVLWSAVNKKMENSATTPTKISVASKSSSSSKELASESTSSKQESSASSKEESSKQESSSSAQSESVASSTSSHAESSSSVASSSSSSAATGTYTVKAGDNLYRIAKNHGMSTEELVQLNGMTTTSTVVPGQVLKVK